MSRAGLLHVAWTIVEESLSMIESVQRVEGKLGGVVEGC